MKQGLIIILFFCGLGSFAQNASASSDKKMIAPPLIVESIDSDNSGNIAVSSAIPAVGQKIENSQSQTVILTTVGSNPGIISNDIIISNASPLPASGASTSRSSSLSLTPIEEN